jgi:hypothetical protein
MSKTIEGVVEFFTMKSKYDKVTMRIEGMDQWFSTDVKYHSGAEPNRGDKVSFNGGSTGKYLNDLKILEGSGTPAGSAPKPSGGGGYSNIGVEVGHASNVATAMAVARFKPAEVGGESYYQFLLEHTQKVYRVIKGLKVAIEAPPAAPLPPAATSTAGASLDDVFND